MARVKAQLTVEQRALKRAKAAIKQALKTAVEDCMDDLVQTSGDAAPHDKGILEGSSAKEITTKDGGDLVVGTVEFAVKEHGFNYAIQMHEGQYNLGPLSEAKPGGVSRLSGKSYEVGPKFLERPLQGDSKAYQAHIESELRKFLKG